MTDVLLDALCFAAYPDAREALARARRAGARVVVVSNWDVSLVQALERTGLAPLLDGVVTSAAVGVGKPLPAIFAAALDLAGAGPTQCLHVGDSLAEDVAGALAIGIPAVWLRRAESGVDGEVPDGVRVIAALDELDLSSEP
jgi:putative hydrolase of the HAD superfamily